MEISAPMVAAGVGVLSVAGGWVGNWIGGQFSAIKATQKTLFEKKDVIEKELNEFKLDVAKNYVNRDSMDKALSAALAPVISRLDELHDDMRQMRRKDS